MKAFRIIAVLLVFAFSLHAADMIQKTLPNGLKVVVKENRENNSVAFYFLVHSGAENEGPYLGCGLSHYLEHVVSGGSTTLHSEAEYKEMEKRIGAIVNAYTTSEETAFYIQADRQFSDDALRMLSEHVMLCSFDSTEVAREKEVILKEIVMRSTPPMAQAIQRMQETVYPNSPKGKPVIGYPEQFRTVTREQLMDYYHAKYMPNNAVFVACGDFDAAETMTAIENAFKNWERGTVRFTDRIAQNPVEGENVYTEQFDIPQPITFVNTLLTPADYQDATALDAAFEALFGSRQAPIRYELVEKRKWVSSVYGGVETSPDSPDGYIMFGFDVQDSLHAADILPYIDEQIALYAKGGFKQKDLDRVIQRERSRQMLSTPDADTEANRIGRAMLHQNRPSLDDIHLARLRALKPEDLSAALRKFLVPRNRVVYNAVPLRPEAPADNNPTAIRADARKIEIDRQLTLLYRENHDKPVIRGIIHLPISNQYATPENVRAVNLMLDQAFSGSKLYPPLELSAWEEEHSVRFRVGFDWLGCNISFRCLTEDFPEVRRILTDAMNHPAFDGDELQQAQQEAFSEFRWSQGWGGSLHDEFVGAHLYPGQRGGISLRDGFMQVVQQNPDGLRALYRDWFKADNAIITLFGDLSEGEARKSAQELWNAVPRGSVSGNRIPDVPAIVDSTYTLEFGFEETNIELVTSAPGLDSADFPAMQVINLLLNGSRGRLFEATRGGNTDLAYYAYANYDYDRTAGSLHLISQTSLPNRERLVQVMGAELDRLASEPVTRADLDLAIEENRKIIASYFTDNLLPTYMTNSEARGQGFDYFYRMESELKKVTPDDIRRVAGQYCAHRMVLVSQPNAEIQRSVE